MVKFTNETKLFKGENMRLLILTLPLLLLACGKPSNGSNGAPGVQGEPGDNAEQSLTVKSFAVINKLSYGSFSSSSTQLDTLCVNLTGKDLNALQSQLDSLADSIGGDTLNFYLEYKKNDFDYTTNCLGSFPVTFTSTRTGQTHTVSSNAQCRTVTSDLVATEYVEYLKSGGAPILLPAKIKVGGCTGAAAPVNSRIQSIDGAMLSDFASIL
jgi:hypothetical protein